MNTNSARLRSSVLGAALVLCSVPAFAQQSAQQGPPLWGQNPNGMHIYLRAGLKTHGPGLHDYPQFLADWSKLLTNHGAVVDGSLHAPSAMELEHTDVLVIYKGDSGYTLEAEIPYKIVDKSDPIMQGMPDMTISDEAFFNMTWAKDPPTHVLATAVIPGTPSAGVHKGEVVPQIWEYEHTLPGGQPARAFVWMQGHVYANFANPQIQTMLLRALAWAGKKPITELVDYVPPAR